MLLGARQVATALRHVGERPRGPSGELAFAALLGARARRAQVAPGFVELSHLALADAAFGQCIPALPPSAELGEDLDAGVEVGKRRFVLLTLLVQPPFLYR